MGFALLIALRILQGIATGLPVKTSVRSLGRGKHVYCRLYDLHGEEPKLCSSVLPARWGNCRSLHLHHGGGLPARAGEVHGPVGNHLQRGRLPGAVGKPPACCSVRHLDTFRPRWHPQSKSNILQVSASGPCLSFRAQASRRRLSGLGGYRFSPPSSLG